MFISDDGVDVYIQCIQRKAVFGKRKFTGCFTAINFDSCRSRRDPLLPNDIFMGNVGLLITKLTYTVTWAPAAARPKRPSRSFAQCALICVSEQTFEFVYKIWGDSP